MKIPGCRAVHAAVALAASAAGVSDAATIIWRVETPGTIAGHATRVLGAPISAGSPFGPAVQFDGVGDGIFVPENPLAGWPAFTVEVLFRVEPTGGFEQRFLHLGTPNSARALVELRLTPEKQWYLDTFLASGTNNRTLIDPAHLHPADAWYWVALTYDGKVMTHYVNGVREMSGELEIPPLPEGETSIGVRQTLVSWFHGTIREVRFHDSALPADKLQQLPASQ